MKIFKWVGILYRHIKSVFIFIWYNIATERILNKMDELAKNANKDRLRAFVHAFGKYWYNRKMAYLWIKRNRKDGYFKFVPDEHRIKAKQLWDTAPIKKVNNSLIGRYLYVFRDEIPCKEEWWKYTYSETYGQVGVVVLVETIDPKYDTINRHGYIGITQCRFATEDEIMRHILEVFEDEMVRHCKYHNIIPVDLKK